MLSELEFESWCERNDISRETREYINKNIRFAQPARSVGGWGENLTGKYPSRKMGVTIQWESGKVEGPAVLMLENDDEVLEYYDQPNKINLSFISNSGKKGGTLYTPDFFVIRKNSAGWEEWKNEKDYISSAKKQKWKYAKNEKGFWSCPPGEEFAKDLGLTFSARIDTEINWNLHRNFTFLDDYLRRRKSIEVKVECLEEIKRVIFQEPGISLKLLIEKSNDYVYNADDIYKSIIKNEIFVDLSVSALAEPETVNVFLHKEHSEMYKNLITCDIDMIYPSQISLEVGSKILWDNHVWKLINIGHNSVSMISEGLYNELPKELFDSLINQGKIIGELKEQRIDNSLIDIITSASEEDYKVANDRLRYVKKYLASGSKQFDSILEPSLRTIRYWVKNYRQAEKLFGNGYIGLIPEHKNKGNRYERINIKVTELMDFYIENEYETKVQKHKSIVYGLFANACREEGYIPPSLTTFCKRIKERSQEKQTMKRQGKRAQYQTKVYYWELEKTTPRHGDFPFNIGHLDHTELDIELLCSRTGKKLGRPYLSLLIDAYSRKVLSYYLSFEPPSYRSCMMVLRDCVRRFNRMPQQIVVDNGKEFHSVYFETLLAMYEREPKRRPPANPRFGSILERLFGTTNTNFIHNLYGNTKITKNVRGVTKSVDPKNLATWNLIDLSSALEEFFFELYDTIEHPSLGLTPRETFKRGLFYSGERKEIYIPYDRLFEILTLPSSKTGEATIQQAGVKINYIYYWNDEFKSLHSQKKKVKIRFDPFNIGVAYIYLNKRWIKCHSQYYSIFKNITQKQLKYITTELRKSKQLHSKSFTINAQRIADFISKIENNEHYSILKSRADETKKVIYAVFNDSSLLEEESLNNVDIIKTSNEIELIKDEVQTIELLDTYGDF
ncbi:DDE-type integrase/transposase/recombinase [Cytobacillus praedii]|uniref:DDE-type integrase/transposase/recombinase n=1 Tax=Cytobacillus praedii TaxID=1742358 RepID=UPI003AF4AB90